MLKVLSIKRYSSHAAKSYYDILSIPRNATTEEIKAAYYKKAKDCHPDISRGSAAEFQRLTEAYETLNDSVKRRAYDTATRNMGSMGFTQAYPPRNSRPETNNRSSPIDLKKDYLQHVYKTMNREEHEKPKFRPFEDHCYPGSHYNRFEYSRKWDGDSGAWIYKKRPTADAYNKTMRRKTLGLHLSVTVIMFAIGINLAAYKFLLKGLSAQSSKPSADLKDGKRGMYIIPDASKP